MLSFPKTGDVVLEAEKYVTKEVTPEMEKEGLVVKNANEALQGAEDIIAEIISDEPKYRRWIRRLFQMQSSLVSQLKDVTLDPKHTYEMYYNYQEPISEIKLHRILAINRGEAEKVIKVSISEDVERVLRFLRKQVIKDPESVTAPYVNDAIEDSYKR